MKQSTTKLIAVFAIATAIFTSCLKDSGKRSYKVYTPVIEQTIALRSSVKNMAPTNVANVGKLFVLGNYVFLNEQNKGIHIIDNTNPSLPKNVSFINIPGNNDMVVQGNILYADCYTDLLAIDISNPNNVVIKNFIEDIFSDKRTISGFTTPFGSVITNFTIKDTSMDVEIGEGQGIWSNNSYVTNTGWFGGGVLSVTSSSGGNQASATKANTGIAGSMSRFAIVNNYLYSVSKSTLNSINISNPANLAIASKQNIGWDIETIYPFKNKLFIGSQSGMQIFSVANAAQPTFVSNFSHARLCDPVIADDNYAYITLHSSVNRCVGTQNELDIVDISNLSNPKLIKRVNLTKPQGLSKDGNTLIVCDDDAGIRIFDATNPENPILTQTIALAATYDVICNNGIALVSAKDGLHQYNYSNANNVIKLSSFKF
jgi:hypothetical protein